MKKYKFTETETDPLAYRCDHFGDNSGQYVKADEAERKIEELMAIIVNALHSLRKIAMSNSFIEMQEISIKQFCRLQKRLDKVDE